MHLPNLLPLIAANARLLSASVLIICAAFVWFTTGCASTQSAKTFHPKSIPPRQGAVVGHVRVFKGEDEVTGSCFISFTDEKEQGQVYSLDDSGWVFTTLPQGPQYLSFVSCVVWNGLTFGTRELRFDVAGHSRSTYFGHVRFDLADEDAEVFWNAAAAGVAGVPVTSVPGAFAATGAQALITSVQLTSPDGTNRVTAEDHVEVAIAQYEQRFRQTPDISFSLAGAPPEPAPTVRKNGDVLSVDSRFNGMLLVWTASLKEGEPRLIVRLNRLGTAPLFANCNEVEITANRTDRRHPLKYQTRRSAKGVRETLESEIDFATLDSVARARSVEIKACKVKGKLSPTGIQAAAKLAAGFRALLAELPSRAPSSESVPTTPGAAESAPTPAPSSADQTSPSPSPSP